MEENNTTTPERRKRIMRLERARELAITLLPWIGLVAVLIGLSVAGTLVHPAFEVAAKVVAFLAVVFVHIRTRRNAEVTMANVRVKTGRESDRYRHGFESMTEKRDALKAKLEAMTTARDELRSSLEAANSERDTAQGKTKTAARNLNDYKLDYPRDPERLLNNLRGELKTRENEVKRLLEIVKQLLDTLRARFVWDIELATKLFDMSEVGVDGSKLPDDMKPRDILVTGEGHLTNVWAADLRREILGIIDNHLIEYRAIEGPNGKSSRLLSLGILTGHTRPEVVLDVVDRMLEDGLLVEDKERPWGPALVKFAKAKDGNVTELPTSAIEVADGTNGD